MDSNQLCSFSGCVHPSATWNFWEFFWLSVAQYCFVNVYRTDLFVSAIDLEYAFGEVSVQNATLAQALSAILCDWRLYIDVCNTESHLFLATGNGPHSAFSAEQNPWLRWVTAAGKLRWTSWGIPSGNCYRGVTKLGFECEGCSVVSTRRRQPSPRRSIH